MKIETFEKLMFICFLLVPLIFLLTLKIGGASNLPILIEQDGYCKLAHSSDWKFDERKLDCYNIKDREQRENFTEEQFRSLCPKNTFLSTNFYSNCFHGGDTRNKW